MEEHANEELVVVEANTVGDPGAVMVHLQDASVALRAMMASVWLRLVAPLANSYATELLLLNRHVDAHC